MAYWVSESFKDILQIPSFSEGWCLSFVNNPYYEEDQLLLSDGKVPETRLSSKHKERELGDAPESNQAKGFYYYFNFAGDTVLKLDTSIRLATPFKGGLAAALNWEKKVGFINKKGEWVIQPKYKFVLKGSYLDYYLVIPYFDGEYAYIKSKKGYIDRNGNEYFEGAFKPDKYYFSH